MSRFLARVRLPLAGLALLGIVVGVFAQQLWVTVVTFVLLLVALAIYFRVDTIRTEPRPVRPPVVGRWVPVNSPGRKVPSHGLHAWGQTAAAHLRQGSARVEPGQRVAAGEQLASAETPGTPPSRTCTFS